jgi:hypothetical protein
MFCGDLVNDVVIVLPRNTVSFRFLPLRGKEEREEEEKGKGKKTSVQAASQYHGIRNLLLRKFHGWLLACLRDGSWSIACSRVLEHLYQTL